MKENVKIKHEVLEGLLCYAQMAHPREGILLLRGKADKHSVSVNDTIIPPFATHGHGFSGFPLSSLPIDFSIVGVAHSHPSGVAELSTVDHNLSYGRITVIIAYPYQSQRDLAVFDTD
ncbi:MAG: peptidase, partial [Thermoproteota archaeon]